MGGLGRKMFKPTRGNTLDLMSRHGILQEGVLIARPLCACGPAAFQFLGRVKWEGEDASYREGDIASE